MGKHYGGPIPAAPARLQVLSSIYILSQDLPGRSAEPAKPSEGGTGPGGKQAAALPSRSSVW